MKLFIERILEMARKKKAAKVIPHLMWVKDSPVRCPEGHRICHIAADTLSDGEPEYTSYVNGNTPGSDCVECAK